MKWHSVVVPLDGSVESVGALAVAATLAQIEKARLHLVQLGQQPLPSQETMRALGLTDAQMRECVPERAGGDPAEDTLRVAHSQREALIVLYRRTGEEEGGGELGRLAEAVLLHGPCPVVLVPPRDGLRPWKLRHVLLPQDGTPAMGAAIKPGAELAQRAGAEVFVLHVARPGAARPVEPGTLTTPHYLDQPQHEWPAWASEFLARMTALGHLPESVHLRLSVAAGQPGEAIVHFAQQHEIDLIVLAWQGHWGAQQALTAKKVVSAASAPVLLKRTGPQPDEAEHR